MRLRIRKGFTLVELLVVIAIIGILVGLLLPAVQAAREAARRMQCSNNVKQLSLAAHTYHDAHKSFPIGYAQLSGPGLTTFTSPTQGRQTSWLTGILPFIEQSNLFNQINFAQGIALPAPANPPLLTGNNINAWVATQKVPGFKCPSDSSPDTLAARGDTPTGVLRNIPFAVTSYKGVAGANWGFGNLAIQSNGAPWNVTRFGVTNPSNGLDRGNGMYMRGWNNPYRTNISDVTDGTSNTLMIGESVSACCDYNWWWLSSGTIATTSIPLNSRAYCTAYNPATMTKRAGLIACRDDWNNNYGFVSEHTGGGNFGLADGSVRFISDSVDRDNYRASATISGGEVTNLGE